MKEVPSNSLLRKLEGTNKLSGNSIKIYQGFWLILSF